MGLRQVVKDNGGMGIVTSHLFALIAKQVEDHRLVVWYDPEQTYALWIYYHQIDRDMLFKALLNYVEPKIRLEESRFKPLRAQRAGAGTAGKGVHIAPSGRTMPLDRHTP